MALGRCAVAQSETFSHEKNPETKLLSDIDDSFTLIIWGALIFDWTTFACLTFCGFLSSFFFSRKQQIRILDFDYLCNEKKNGW